VLVVVLVMVCRVKVASVLHWVSVEWLVVLVAMVWCVRPVVSVVVVCWSCLAVSAVLAESVGVLELVLVVVCVLVLCQCWVALSVVVRPSHPRLGFFWVRPVLLCRLACVDVLVRFDPVGAFVVGVVVVVVVVVVVGAASVVGAGG